MKRAMRAVPPARSSKMSAFTSVSSKARNAVVQQRPDRFRERGDAERLVQEEPSKTQPHPIVIDFLRTVPGHQENLDLWAEGVHLCRELQSGHEGHLDIRKE